MSSDVQGLVRQLSSELANFEEIAHNLVPQPGELPRLAGLDIYGGTRPLNGVVGGDHLIYIDFKQRFDLDARIQQAITQGRPDIVDNLRRCQRMAGIALVDVSGHRVTDALMTAMLHQAFLLGAIYELDMSGHVTRRLFENLNTRFYQSSSAHKFISMIYGEITEDSKFRFLSAAQSFPLVFSAKNDRFMEVSEDLRVSFPPLGTMPSLHVIDHRRTTTSTMGFKDRYEMNEWLLMGRGDILLLLTDGLSEHQRDGDEYTPRRLEQVIRAHKTASAAELYSAVMTDLVAFSPPTDDVSLVVIKRT